MQDMEFDRVPPGELGQQPEHTLINDEFLRLIPLVDRETIPAKITPSKAGVFGLVFSVRETNPETFGPDLKQPNRIINFSLNGRRFYTLASQQLMDWHFTGDTQCLPLYRYTPDGERVSNITQWDLRRFREHYGDDGITAEDIFAYVYAMLHDPAYRHDLLREFPRPPLYHAFHHCTAMGWQLLDLHIGFESAEP